jgi:hypothetical protein
MKDFLQQFKQDEEKEEISDKKLRNSKVMCYLGTRRKMIKSNILKIDLRYLTVNYILKQEKLFIYTYYIHMNDKMMKNICVSSRVASYLKKEKI